MKNFKYYVSICLVSMVCAIVGSLIYSQNSVAKDNGKNIDEAAATTELLSYESADFRYKQIGTSETPPVNFQAANFDDSAWNIGNAAFGSGGGGCLPETVRTNWDVNSRLLVRKIVNVPANAGNLKIYIAGDNDIEGVFVNSTQVGGNFRGGCAYADAAVYQVPDNLLLPGENLVVYHLYDDDASSYFDTRITADVVDEMLAQQHPLESLTLQNAYAPTAPGDVDLSFETHLGNSGSVNSIVLQPDGKILIGGDFNAVSGSSRSRIARLNADGSLDTSFNPGSGANDRVSTLALQPDGKILMGGYFSLVSGISRNRIARLNTDGSLDTSFNPGSGANSNVYALALQPDGKILIGGIFTTVNGISRNRIAQLNGDGSPGTSFNPGSGTNSDVYALALQPDGKILIGGSFTMVNGIARTNVARFFGDSVPSPDLTVTALSAPVSTATGTAFEVSWRVNNAGTSQAVAPWKEKMYLSNDNQISAGDTVLGVFDQINSLNPNQTADLTQSLMVPLAPNIPSGTYYLIVQTDSDNNVSESNENNNTDFRAMTIDVLAPDLQVLNTVTSPTQTDTDSSFNVSWSDKNFGNLTANAPWTDKILLSTDNQPSVNDTVLGTFPLTASLDPNQIAERIQTISIPRSSITQDGSYFLIIQTDANNNVNEGANENNNFVAKPISVRKTPLPDLIIQNITAPDTAFFGQTIRVQWTTKNNGNGPTNAAEWQDWYYISSDNVPEIEDPFKAPLQNISYLAAGESYTASADITIPQGLVGNYKIIVWTDSDGSNHRTPAFPMNVIEENEINNWGIARPIQITVPPLPDLQTTLVQAQDEAFTGQPFNLNWRVENRGAGTTPPSLTAWNDKIYLSQNTTFEPNVDRLIGSRPHDGVLAVND